MVLARYCQRPKLPRFYFLKYWTRSIPCNNSIINQPDECDSSAAFHSNLFNYIHTEDCLRNSVAFTHCTNLYPEKDAKSNILISVVTLIRYMASWTTPISIISQTNAVVAVNPSISGVNLKRNFIFFPKEKLRFVTGKNREIFQVPTTYQSVPSFKERPPPKNFLPTTLNPVQCTMYTVHYTAYMVKYKMYT